MNFQEISVHDTPDRSPGLLLWQISTTWRAALEKVLKPLGLTHPQFVILATLGWLTRKGDRVSQAAIGKMASLDPNTVSQIIRGLEQKKLIRREESSDAQAKNPLFTKKGADILKKALPAVERQDDRFFHPLAAEELERMMGLFLKLMQ